MFLFFIMIPPITRTFYSRYKWEHSRYTMGRNSPYRIICENRWKKKYLLSEMISLRWALEKRWVNKWPANSSFEFFIWYRIWYVNSSHSMTSLLKHNVAHSTRYSFRPKTNNQSGQLSKSCQKLDVISENKVV